MYEEDKVLYLLYLRFMVITVEWCCRIEVLVVMNAKRYLPWGLTVRIPGGTYTECYTA